MLYLNLIKIYVNLIKVNIVKIIPCSTNFFPEIAGNENADRSAVSKILVTGNLEIICEIRSIVKKDTP